MKKDARLFSVGYDSLGHEDADIDFDENGNMIMVEGPAYVEQSVIKALHTKLKTWGYGSMLHDIIGSKNMDLVRAAAIYSAKRCIEFVAWLQHQHAALQEMEPEELLAEGIQVAVKPNRSNSQIILETVLRTDDGKDHEVSTSVMELR